MNRIGKFTRILSAMIVAGSLAIAGCAWPASVLRPRTSALPVTEAPPPRAPAPLTEEPNRPDEPTLAAIENFLARTTDFAHTPSGADSKGVGNSATASDNPEGPSTASLKAPPNGPAAERALANTQLALPEPAVRRTAVARPVVTEVAIRVPSPTSVQAPPPANIPNAPASAAGGADGFSWDRALQQLDTEAQSKQDFRSSWAALLVRVALGRETEGVAVGGDLPIASREWLTHLVRAIRMVGDAAASTDVSSTPVLHALDELRGLLAGRADLEVSPVELCRKVLTFGVYDALLDTELTAGREIPAIVYCEVRNFLPEQDADGRFVTRLATRLEVFSVDGTSVLERSEPEIVDACRTRRSDFFLAQRITLPGTLNPGEYVLKLTVEDLRAAKVGEGTKPFTLSPKTPVAQGR